MNRPFITRFAPSPTGLLHLGHAYAAKVAHDLAVQSGGKMILRIDDIDHTRCRDNFTTEILTDLDWLGLAWHGSPTADTTGRDAPRQSRRMPAYQAALETLQDMGLVYPCYLSRQELNALLSAPHTPPTPSDRTEPDGALPNGTGRRYVDPPALASGDIISNTDQLLSEAEINRRRAAGNGAAWRLRMDAALEMASGGPTDGAIGWFDYLAGYQTANPAPFGDVVIARADIAVSYHLSVVVDDMLDGVTLVTRGNDLAPSTHLHRLLQALLGLQTPDYCHHALILDQAGNRLAKRDSAHSLQSMRLINNDPARIFSKMPPIPVIQPRENPQKT